MEEVQAVIRQRSLLKRLFGHFKCSKAELSYSIGLGSFIAAISGSFLESIPVVAQYYPSEWAQPLICLSIAPFFWVACVFMFNKGWADLDYDGPLPEESSWNHFRDNEIHTSIHSSGSEIDWGRTHAMRSVTDTSIIVFKS